jgi:hypothetical protein
MRTWLVAAAVAVGAYSTAGGATPAQNPPEGTFSIVARDPAAGELGMAVQSKALATGSRTITIKGGVAAIAHQSSSNPMYGAPKNRAFESLLDDPAFKKLVN